MITATEARCLYADTYEKCKKLNEATTTAELEKIEKLIRLQVVDGRNYVTYVPFSSLICELVCNELVALGYRVTKTIVDGVVDRVKNRLVTPYPWFSV